MPCQGDRAFIGIKQSFQMTSKMQGSLHAHIDCTNAPQCTFCLIFKRCLANIRVSRFCLLQVTRQSSCCGGCRTGSFRRPSTPKLWS